MNLSPTISNNGIWFFLAGLVLIIQYVRPHDIFTSLEVIRPYLLAVTLLTACILISGKNWFQTNHAQMTQIWLLLAVMVCLFPLSSYHAQAYETIRVFALLIPLMLSVLILVDNVSRLKQVVLFLTIMTSFIAIRGLATHGGFEKGTHFTAGNFLSDPNDYSLFMNMMLPFPFACLSFVKSRFKKFLCFGVIALIILSIIISFSRGGLLGLICVAVTLAMFHPRRKAFLLSGTLIMLLVVPFVINDQWKDEMSTATDTRSDTAQTRLVMWEASFKAFLHKPIGIGPGNVGAVSYKYVDSPDFPEQYFYGTVAHSVWFTALAEWGIVGFLIFLNIIYLNFKDTLLIARIPASTLDQLFIKSFGISCMASLVGILSSGTFLTINYYPHFWYLTAIICAASKLVYDLDFPKHQREGLEQMMHLEKLNMQEVKMI